MTVQSPRTIDIVMANKIINAIPDAKRSVLRQLEELLPEIEDGLARGYSHSAMHAALPALGIKIGLPYYHRALNMLRKERREGKVRPTAQRTSGPEPGSGPDVPDPARARSDVKASVLPVALAKSSPDSPSTINSESSGPKPFKWSGREFLDKDWSNF